MISSRDLSFVNSIPPHGPKYLHELIVVRRTKIQLELLPLRSNLTLRNVPESIEEFVFDFRRCHRHVHNHVSK